MKRMYVILGVFLLALLWAFSGFTQKQDPPTDPIARHMQLREELHRKMLNNLFHGTHDEDLFRDMEKLMDDAMKDSFSDMSSFSYSFGAQNFETEWTESESGRTLYITPQSPEQKLDINVEKNMVTIKGKTENKTPNGTSISDFQNSFSIPQDCDSSKVKMDQESGKIVMFFPWKTAKKESPKKQDRVPLPKDESDVTI
jgi:HSP20 family molecular chaperone IbpA